MNMARYDWGFVTEPEPHLGGRRLACPRGKVLGGSSSINGMVYVRGHPRDFDTWAEMGADGWGWADVAPYFKRMETWHGGASDWRGTDGPLHVTRGPRANPLYHAFVEAGAQAGFETTADYNGAKQEGFGPMEQTVWHGRRWSAANAYLRPALRGGKVAVLRCLAARVAIRDGRAVGVEIARGAARETVTARREVILAASAINTPKLLMLSGIGPAAHLAEHGIPVIADRPGVGGNLQDHLELYVQMRSRLPVTLYRHYNWPSRLRDRGALAAAEVRPRRLEPVRIRGLRALGAGGRLPRHPVPLPAARRALRRQGGGARPRLPGACRPDALAVARRGAAGRRRSRGAARDPLQLHGARRGLARLPPLHPARPRDLRPARLRALRRRRDPARRRGRERRRDRRLRARSRWRAPITPAAPRVSAAPTIRWRWSTPNAGSSASTGLRVADSSVFPRITNGNLNAPSIMVGEKAADHILGRTPLPPWNAAPWINPRWRVCDR